MDTTNVNLGERGELKHLLKHTIPYLNWVGCGNHKLALCFKHPLQEFQTVQETGVFLKTLWKFFKYCSLVINLLEKCPEICGESVVVPARPSVTQWAAHVRACVIKSMCYHSYQKLPSICINLDYLL